jgi:hypothetical protein
LKYEQVKSLSDEQFRRLTGVKRSTFDKMIEILEEADKKKKTKGGRRNKLSMENQLLMALEYIREYRTYFHVSQSYGISGLKIHSSNIQILLYQEERLY